MLKLAARNRTLARIAQTPYVELYLRFNEKERYCRIKYCKTLKRLSRLTVRENVPGGVLTEDGEFYLKTFDGIFLFYNFTNDRYTLGDGQALDFRPVRTAQPLERFLLGYLKDGMVYFDVGANNGYYYSLKVSKAVRGCRVYAFEPDPRILLHLRKNISYNGIENVTVVPKALSNFVGCAWLTAYLGASNFLLINSKKQTSLPMIDVECTTLDDFVLHSGVERIDLIKVDIEGGEHNFLEGSRASLLRFKPIMVLELDPNLLHRNGTSVSAAESLLSDMGYDCRHVKDSTDAIAIPKDKSGVLTESDDLWLEKN
jgi:FkbM family methyltransferase